MKKLIVEYKYDGTSFSLLKEEKGLRFFFNDDECRFLLADEQGNILLELMTSTPMNVIE
jgi:hypothetical protein